MFAAIIFDGSVVSIENLDLPEFSFNGFLQSFYYKGKAFRYCDIDDVRESKAINDYYDLVAYRQYRNNKISIEELTEKHRFKHFINYGIKPLTETVTVIVQKIYFSEPNYDELFFTRTYRWEYVVDEKIFFYNEDFDPVISLPQRAIDNAGEAFPRGEVNPLVQSFFNNNKYLIHVENLSINKPRIAYHLNHICWTMQRIVEDIFPLFSSNSQFNAYINRQLEIWETEQIMEEPIYGLLVSYQKALSDFYRVISLSRSYLHTLTSKEKLHYLTKILGERAISLLPIDDRFDVLKLLIKEYLSNYSKVPEEEEIVVKIVKSFAYNDESDRNTFLKRLTNPDFNGEGEKGKTMYEVLYNRMSTAWEITRSTIALMNWAFNATWQPDDTRAMFVKAIYCIWLRSEYNPYDFDTDEIRLNSIALKKRINGTMHYQTNDVTDDLPPNFSTSKPNDVKYFYTEIPGYKSTLFNDGPKLIYKVVEEEAAPILFNYSSKEKHGYYLDNSRFTFRNEYIIAYNTVSTTPTFNLIEPNNKYKDFNDSIFAGKYHIMQPVHLNSDSLETAEPMFLSTGETININGTNINSLVPVFFLKYIDDLGDSKDLQTLLGDAVDVISTFIPMANLAKLRHIRHLTRFGQALLVIESVQISASVINFFLGFIDNCNSEGTLCKKIRTMLFYVEMSSLATDTFLFQKARKSAKDAVEDALENGWPLEMLDEIPGTGGVTPKMKLEELAGDISKFREEFINKSKSLLKTKLDADTVDFISRYNDEDLTEIFTIGTQKGLSVDDTVGVVHQACRKRNPDYTASTSVLSTRMDNLIIVKKRGYPLNFSSLAEFNNYIEEKLIPLLENFGIPKNNARYGGSAITSTTSFSSGPQDTDWWIIFASKEDEANFVKEISNRIDQFQLDGKLKAKKAKSKKEYLEKCYSERGFITPTCIGGLDDTGNVVFWTDVVDHIDGKDISWLDRYFGVHETDISFKLQNKIPLPSIKRKL